MVLKPGGRRDQAGKARLVLVGSGCAVVVCYVEQVKWRQHGSDVLEHLRMDTCNVRYPIATFRVLGGLFHNTVEVCVRDAAGNAARS